MHRIKNLLLILIVSNISCLESNKDHQTKKSKQKNVKSDTVYVYLTSSDNTFTTNRDFTHDNKKIFNTTKIILAEYFQEKYNFWGQSNYSNVIEWSGAEQIEKFEKLLKETIQSSNLGYPTQGFVLTFYDKDLNYRTYFIDTLESKSFVEIYNITFEFSHKIPKAKWKEALRWGKRITKNEYFISDLKIARKVFDYAIKLNLPVVYSYRFSNNKWPLYDGEFKFTASRAAKDLSIEEVINNVKKIYPKDKFCIEVTNYNRICGSYDGNDCITECTYTISCDTAFYRKFDIYKPKSYYRPLIAEILVLGTKESLKGLDKIAEKEK